MIQLGPDPISEPTAYLGIFLVLPALAARITGTSGLSTQVGALAAGALIGTTSLVSRATLITTKPFSDLAKIWIGLSLGTALPPTLIFERRFFISSFAAVLAGTVISCFILLIAFPFKYALQIGLLSSISAPVFIHISQPVHRDALSISLLTTTLGLLILGFSQIIIPWEFPEFLKLEMIGKLIIWGIGIELIFQTLRKVRTNSGQYILFAILTFLLLIVSRSQHIPILFLSMVSGLALSVRFGKNSDTFRTLRRLSKLLIPFILADFTAHIAPKEALHLGLYHWQILAIYTIAMTTGKTIEAMIGSRLSRIPFQSWCPILPQDIIACILFPLLLPPTEQFMPNAFPLEHFQFGFLLVCGIGISLLHQLIQKIKITSESHQ